MSHWPVVPLLLPLLAGALALLLRPQSRAARVVGIAASVALVATSGVLLTMAWDGELQVYALGEWPAPFGIVLVVDRLSAAMVALTSVVALACVLYAVAGDDARGPYFHALFQFQLLGVNGAFLTGDLFNLFVFFEILLIASYTLLMHGHGVARTRAAVQVVALNLVGSALFLIAVGALYSVTGSLNMADLARLVATLPESDVGIARASALLLLVVFALKAAALPVGFWLPRTYAAAAAPVAALFAIMTKVGIYAIARLFTLVFGADAGPLAGIAAPWVVPAGIGTIAVAAAGALAATELRKLIGWMVMASVGTALIAVGQFSVDGLAAALFYAVHSTLVGAALFLIADLVRRQRAAVGTRLDASGQVRQPALLGGMFFVGAISACSLPPFSGFAGKVMVLEATLGGDLVTASWLALLVGGLVVTLSMARAGSALFWKSGSEPSTADPAPRLAVAAVVALLAASPALVVLGGPMSGYARDMALQLTDTRGYREAVLADTPPAAHRRDYR
ncbi:MAG: monovalent cation/H+ antiporter subunit D [Ectothiorhodospiraceae bacterium]|nr:monovalent cation/H+ antiporter subunit D [Ectothiorhodospiraceae bacterium]